MTRLLLLALLLGSCATRRIALPMRPEIPPNADYWRCWTAQDRRYVECVYTIEKDDRMEFRQARGRR